MRNSFLRCAVLSGLFLAPVGFCGCASPPANLHLTSVAHHEAYRQQFTHAYAAHRDGNLDVVLLDDAAAEAMAGRSSTVPVQQVMHIRVLWNASREIKADQPSATNASLHWYVLGEPRTRPGEMLEYTGTGFVCAEESDGESAITIRNATLKPAMGRGLTDPVGSSKLEGKIIAQCDDARVTKLLSAVRTATATAMRTTPTVHAAAMLPAPPHADAAP